MINLKIEIDCETVLKQVQIDGHSCYDVKGSDIVCSAVSILFYSVLATLQKTDKIKIDFKDDVKCIILNIAGYDKDYTAEFRGVTLTFINGVKLLQKDDSKNINLKIKEN